MYTSVATPACIAVSLMCVWLVSASQCQADDKPADPVALLKPILAKVEKEGTEEIVTDFVESGKWEKRKYLASAVKFDVRKTDSLVSPFVATVTFDPKAYITPSFGTKQEAEKANLPKDPKTGAVRWWAELAFQDGKWVVQDCGWKLGAVTK